MISLPVVESSQVGAARRRAVQEAEAVGLAREECERLALVVTEAATNLLRHAKAGEIIIAPCRNGVSRHVDVIALDDGPGLVNIEAAMSDGFTTAGEARRGIGGGLGAIARMSDRFDIHSDPRGTTVFASIGPMKSKSRGVETAGLIVPKPNLDEGGDAFAVRVEGALTLLMLMDVLGHGPAAATEARKGVAAFREAKGANLEESDLAVKHALAGTRGAAALIVEVPSGPGTLRAIGLGNVRGEITVPGGASHGIPSSPGIVGASTKEARSTEHDWPEDAVLVLTTDGLKSSGLQPEPAALFFRRPATIAATLYKRRRRGTDDSGVLVARNRS